MGVSAFGLAWVFLFGAAAAGLGLGHLLRARLRGYKDEAVLDQFVLNTSLGLGGLSLLLFALGALHSLQLVHDLTVVIAVSASISALIVLGIAVLHIRDWVKAANRSGLPSWKTIVWILAFVCLGVAVLIPAAAPPSGSDWDSLAYHLSIPKLYLQHGGFYYIDSISHSNFPFLVEMLYTPALSQGDPAGAKMVHYLYGVLLVLAVVMLVRKHFDANAAPLAALGVVSMPLVLWEATTAYIDLATALYTVLAVCLLLDYLDKAELRALIGCGIAAGFAASTKMTGLTLIPLLALWLLIDRWSAQGRVEWKRALAFAGVALLTCSPWYIKTFIYTGNPVYPFFYSIFGGKDWTTELAQNYTMLQAKFGMGHGIAWFLMLPWNLTFHSDRFYDTPGLFIGPILLVAVPLMLIAKYKSRKLLGLTLFFLAQMVIWFTLTQQSRYLIPAFALLAVIIAWIAYSDDRFKITRVALYVVFAAMALFGVLTLWPSVESAAPVVFGSETQDDYLSRTLSIYPAEKWVNENTPPNVRIGLFGDTRGFYLDRFYVWADPGHNKRFTRRFASVGEFVSYLKRQGVGYAMVNFRFFPQRDGAAGSAKLVYQAIGNGQFEQVYGDETGRVAVYKIR